MDLYSDALFHVPASSVQVEKLHANNQLICDAIRGSAGMKAECMQQKTYCKSASQLRVRIYILYDFVWGANKYEQHSRDLFDPMAI